MKKITVFIMITLGLSFFSACSIDDGANQYNFTYKLSPVTEVDIPDTLIYNAKYHFDITFEKPSDCYSFSGFDYTKEGNVRIIGVVNSVLQDSSCKVLDTTMMETRNLDFYVERHDYYKFKFWQGNDSIGEPEYLTKKVVVTESNH